MKRLLLTVFGSCLLVLVGGSFCTAQTPDVEAVVKKMPRAAYPAEAKATGLEGLVTVVVDVDETGRVTSVGEATGPDWTCPNYSRPDVIAMRNAAKEIAGKTTFTPATLAGQPVASRTVVKVEFLDPGRKPPDTISVAKERAGSSDTGARIVGTTDPPTIRLDAPGKVLLPPGSNLKMVSGGVLNGTALKLAKPAYPPAARAVHASGAVNMQVVIDEEGKVFTAYAVSGHPLLTATSRIAACNSEFAPTLLQGTPVKVTGIITYNFVP